MKGSIDIPITIIAAVLVILTIVLAVNSLKQTTVGLACDNYFKKTIETIINRACEMSDSDIDEISTIDLKNCVSLVEFDSSNNALIYKLKGENQPRQLSVLCSYGGPVSYVNFDFSKVGGSLDSEKRTEYNILITNRQISVPQCQGEINCHSYMQNDNLDTEEDICNTYEEMNLNCECHQGCEWLDE